MSTCSVARRGTGPFLHQAPFPTPPRGGSVIQSQHFRSAARIPKLGLRKHARDIGICLTGLSLIAAALTFKPASLDDFLPFYRASRLLGDADLFAQTRFHSGGLMFLRTPFYAWLLGPLGSLDYPAARSVWMGLMALALALSVWLWPGPRKRIAIATCWAPPILFAFALGQDITLVMLLFALTARLWIGGREFAAGLVASLLFLKLTFLLPVAVVFLARSRRGSLGLGLGLAVHVAISFCLQGPAWIPEYLAAVRNPILDQVPTRMPSLRALMPVLPFTAGAVLVYALLWRIARQAALAQALTVALPLGLIATPHCYAYDVTVAIPLFATVFSRSTVAGILATIALCPIPYMLMAVDRPTILGATLLTAAILAGTFSLPPMSGWVERALRRVLPGRNCVKYPIEP